MNSFWLAKNLNIITFQNIYNKSLTEIILEDNSKIKQLKSMKLKKLAPFFIDDNTVKLAKKLWLSLYCSKKTFELANNKLELKLFLLKNKLPTIKWEITSNPKIIKKLFENPKKYIFKLPLWVSWYGFWDNKKII